jgi:hypothetical protein
MRYIKLFDKWYVAREDRFGQEVDDTGDVELVFEDLPTDTVLLLDGQRVRGEDGRYTVNVRDRYCGGGFTVGLLLPSGREIDAEGLCVAKGVTFPAGFDKDDLLLALAERVARLEEAEARDRAELQAIEDKSKGKYFLGGTKK